MIDHAEFEQLSAYLDGELDAVARAAVDAHLVTCDSCREILGALQATLADLETLETPVPSPQDSWALRSAIASARTAEGSRRYPKRVMAAAGIAASVVLIAVATASLTHNSPGRSTTAASAPEAAMSTMNRDFTQASADALIGISHDKTAEDDLRTANTDAFSGNAPGAAAPQAIQPQAETLQNCQANVGPTDGRLVRSFAARYEGSPAYFYVFEAPATSPTRLELWVTARSECTQVLYWAQHRTT